MRRTCVLLAIMNLTACRLHGAEPLKITDPKDQEIVQAFLGYVEKVPEWVTAAKCKSMAAEKPEGYTWILLRYLHMPLTAYRLTGDVRYLDMFVATFAKMRAAMTEGPDGYLGWYGEPLPLFRDPEKPNVKVDVIISSFRAVMALSEFVEVVDRDPALARKYAGQRAEYLRLCEDHLVKKWDARGNYVDLGKNGAVYRTHADLRDVKGHLTQPHNKHSIITQALLRLYCATGNGEYMKKAVKLGTRFKHCLSLKDGHYVWNYWDYAGPWDIDPKDNTKWKHWIGPEHKSTYYGLSLSMAVVLYQYGVVFDHEDIDRFLKTPLEITWNGDSENPQWFKVDGRKPWNKESPYMCAALAPFDHKIEQFVYFGPQQDKRVASAGNAWQGGVVADGWIVGKYLDLPRAKGGKQGYVDAGNRFREKKENRDFLESLDFTVVAPGYKFHWNPTELEKTNPEKGFAIPALSCRDRPAHSMKDARLAEAPEGVVNGMDVDFHQDCESGHPGDAVTAALMRASSHGVGAWSTSGGTMWVSSDRVKRLPGAVIVRGITYTDKGTRTWAVNDLRGWSRGRKRRAGLHASLRIDHGVHRG